MSSHHSSNVDFSAPCLVDEGIVINKVDMLRLLNDLGRVRYVHEHDDQISSQGEGYVVEAFSEPHQATLVANQSLYLNVCSFDYLKMGRLSSQETYFDLIQDNRRLRLVPLSNPLEDQTTRNLNAAALEAMVTEALSASWDACLDDDTNFSQ